ncbi:MAG: hypothetical protein CMB08_04990 [Euryarchaeota archaeon]|nr:hypothetical protein [Euryarchaeota archaeon]|tara:strand:+ start:406 stop:633 length:228 start_codon:yes stop_codon:yes gene_type:complete
MEYENTLICTLCGGSVKTIPEDDQDKTKSSEKKLPFDISESPVNVIFSPILFDIKYAPQYSISPIILFGIDYAPN